MRYIISFALASLAAFPASAEVPRVVTDFPPTASLVAQVMGDLGAPVVLLDKGADAHSFQLRPSQAADLADADAVIWIGPELTPWLDRSIAGLAAEAADLRLLSAPGTLLQPFADAGGHAAHSDAEDPAIHDDHAHPAVDPHAWLNPDNAKVWLDGIARLLAELDPENAATYRTNATTAQAELAALEPVLMARLALARDTPLVMFHDAYGYFAAHFHLTIAGAISPGDAASPGAAHLHALHSAVQNRRMCLFPEANHDPKLIATIAEGTGAWIGAALDPEGSALPNGPALYGQLLRAMAEAIADCAAG